MLTLLAFAAIISVATASGVLAGGCHSYFYSDCPPASAAPSTASTPAAGSYECYTYSGGRLEPMGGLNFAITDTADYTGLDGAPGLYAFDAGSQTLWFSYGALDGQTARYNGNRSPHTITFLDAQNQLSDSCDLKA